MATIVRLDIIAGLPFTKVVEAELPAGRDWWTDESDFEVLLQVREDPERNSRLLVDLAEYITATLTADIVTIVLYMTGAETRLLKKPGHYDMIISDPGTTDARAYQLIKGAVTMNSTVTAEVVGAE